jgi:hypothetical protein
MMPDHEEADAIRERAEGEQRNRAERMPDEQSAINTMWDGYQRLKELGWNDAIHCPKDGSTFLVIEPGSTGIHTASYWGKWPHGGWHVAVAGNLWPSWPILFKPAPDDIETIKARENDEARSRAEAKRPKQDHAFPFRTRP